jgi:ADP-ribosylglycohydrolase
LNYPKLPDLNNIVAQLVEYAKLKHEYGSDGIENLFSEIEKQLNLSLVEIKKLPIDKRKLELEPDKLSEIHKLRSEGPRKMWDEIDFDIYMDKLEGAFLARLVGCTLGAPVEFYSIDHMERWAKYTGDVFPPTDYWKMVKYPNDLRYEKSDFIEYTRDGMNKVPVDDDISYTLLGLLIAEDYGIDFTTKDVGEAWLKYLPYACTAEDIALKNLKKGIKAENVADIDNPYCQWIGADIRSDPFAYIAPAYPEKAASMAYYDAYLSHRRNGIYGEMFFAAVQSAAFAVDHPVKALEIGLSEIPANCSLSKDIKWALEVGRTVTNYRQARKLIEERFKDMSHAHTNNNACLTVFGLMIGGTDMTKVISETVAMGMDNDCTAATAGSIVGAIVGKKGISKHWYKNFNNIVDSYLINIGELPIDEVIKRFAAQAKKIYENN